MKKLEEMSLEELWELFPIFLVKHNDNWEKWYEEEKKNILLLIPKNYVRRISHIGSTSVENIYAKNIVDILLELNNLDNLKSSKEIFLKNGRLCMSEEKYRISLNKGYTKSGFDDKVFHLHVCLAGDNDELYFRDYLISNPNVAKEYEELKLSLWKKYEHNRNAYTDAKSDFIKKYTEIAKKKFKNRY